MTQPKYVVRCCERRATTYQYSYLYKYPRILWGAAEYVAARFTAIEAVRIVMELQSIDEWVYEIYEVMPCST